MDNELLYAIDLEDASGEFEPASELLNALEFDFSSFFDRENCTVRHTVYSTTETGAAENRKKLTAALEEWKELGVELTMGETFTIAKSEWSEAWKKYFKGAAFWNDRCRSMLSCCRTFAECNCVYARLCAYRTLHINAVAGNLDFDGGKLSKPGCYGVCADGCRWRFWWEYCSTNARCSC